MNKAQHEWHGKWNENAKAYWKKPEPGIEPAANSNEARFLMKRTVSLSTCGSANQHQPIIVTRRIHVVQCMSNNTKSHATSAKTDQTTPGNRNPRIFIMFIVIFHVKNNNAQKFKIHTSLDSSFHVHQQSMINLT